MKKSIYSIACVALVFSLLLSSCGPSKKLIASNTKVSNLQKDSVNTHNQLDERNVQVKNLQDEKTSLQGENASVINDLKVLTSESKMTIADQAKQLKDFKTMVQSQKNGMNKLKASISEALMNYKTEELYIYIKDGNVYVSLEENLLFKSGSDVVDPKGKEALKSLALVLNTTKDISVMIEGHTDSVGSESSNLELSQRRADAVRAFLLQNGAKASQITTRGYGKTSPVASNDTAAGRQQNRRVEIIIP